MKDILFSCIGRYPSKKEFVVELNNGTIVDGYVDTCYEDDIGEEYDDDGNLLITDNFFSFMQIVFHVNSVIKMEVDVDDSLVGRLIEFSVFDPPINVWDNEENLLWNISMLESCEIKS